jgi:hypothetical protein
MPDPYSSQGVCPGTGDRPVAPKLAMVQAAKPFARVGVTHPHGRRRKERSGARCIVPEQMFRIPEHGTPIRGQRLGLGRPFLERQLVFVDLFVDATWRDSEEPSGLRLIAVRLVQRSFQQ